MLTVDFVVHHLCDTDFAGMENARVMGSRLPLRFQRKYWKNRKNRQCVAFLEALPATPNRVMHEAVIVKLSRQ